MLTAGLSKKVTWPAVALAALGVVLLIVGTLLQSTVLITAGIALLAAAGIQLPLGYAAPPATTVSDDELLESQATPPFAGPGSDMRLSHETRQEIEATPPPAI